MLNITAEDADLEIRFGTGSFPDREAVHLLSNAVTPVCSPEYLNAVGPFGAFTTQEEVTRARLIRCPL